MNAPEAGHKYCCGCAQEIVESLRFGIPPDGCVRELTVGREHEISYLLNHLSGTSRSLLVKANWGAGKTHLLRLLQEEALARGYITSFVTADANAAVRFNRMDQVFGAACQNIQIPGKRERGLQHLLDVFVEAYNDDPLRPGLREISNNGRWDYSEFLAAPAVFIALRAWLFAVQSTNGHVTRNTILDWFGSPWVYRTQRRVLYRELVDRDRAMFRDSRAEWQFYADNVFFFHTDGHRQSWDALNDLHVLAQALGYAGLILLVDEFEDVIRNLGRINWQQAAFWNLFTMFRGQRFKGQSYFAVTPDFEQRCKRLLLEKMIVDYDYNQFDQLPSCRITPPTGDQLLTLIPKLVDIHEAAYGWKADEPKIQLTLARTCDELEKSVMADRVRMTIKKMVAFLDDVYGNRLSHGTRT
jgi:hypothetical protein